MQSTFHQPQAVGQGFQELAISNVLRSCWYGSSGRGTTLDVAATIAPNGFTDARLTRSCAVASALGGGISFRHPVLSYIARRHKDTSPEAALADYLVARSLNSLSRRPDLASRVRTALSEEFAAAAIETRGPLAIEAGLTALGCRHVGEDRSAEWYMAPNCTSRYVDHRVYNGAFILADLTAMETGTTFGFVIEEYPASSPDALPNVQMLKKILTIPCQY